MKTANTKRVFSPVPTGGHLLFLQIRFIFFAGGTDVLHFFAYPKAVAGVIFKCLLIEYSMRPVQVTKWTFLKYLRRADFVGMNSTLCK